MFILRIYFPNVPLTTYNIINPHPCGIIVEVLVFLKVLHLGTISNLDQIFNPLIKT